MAGGRAGAVTSLIAPLLRRVRVRPQGCPRGVPGVRGEARPGRFELPTCGLGNRRSIQLSYERRGEG